MKRFLCFFFLIIAIFSNLFSQDFNLTGAGARAEGFGGAFIGLADDATAVVWNPAGLTQLERAEASVVTRFISEKASFKYSPDPSFNMDESQGHFSLNFGSFVLPLSTGETKIVIAAAYQRQLDFYYSKSDKYEYTSGFQTYTIINRNEDRGGANTITPAVAIRFTPAISAGMSVNIWTGNLNSKSRTEVVNYGRNLYQGSFDYSGLNFVFGGLYDFEGMKNGFPMKFGITLRTPFTLNAKGPYTVDEEIAVILPSSGTKDFDMTQKIDMPFMLGFGASYRIGDNLTLAMDYEMRNYANKKIKYEATDRSTGNSGTSESNISESKSNFNEFRIGAEYLIVLENGVIPLRMGFKAVPTGFADYKFEASSNEYVPTNNQVKGSSISFGSGFISDTFALDITYSTLSYTQKYDTDGNLDFRIGTLSTSVIIYF